MECVMLFIDMQKLLTRVQIKRTNNIKPLCNSINKISGYIEKSYGNKYLTLVSTVENKDSKKEWTMTQNRISFRSITNNSDNCDVKDMEIKFKWDDNLPLKKVRTLYHDSTC